MDSLSIHSLQDLPIYQRHADIISSVDANQVTIIVAETGAGKSTQVPQYLAEHGYRKIIVTQPRILAARNLAARVRQEYSLRLGKDATDQVGYRTAHERDDSPDNTILYCTDGLQLVRELTGSGIREKQVLILDEIHEWNENMEVLIAWAKKRCQEDTTFKVVLMSATIEADQLSAYFNAPAPLTVAGRSFAVEKRHGSDLVTEIVQQIEQRVCNMLVFLPGKAEIEAVGSALSGKVPGSIPIIPLHSQLDLADQQRAFAHYPGGKIVLATNVAQTSVTIDDIDVVIDSGLERRAEVRSGVEGLFIEEVSQADCLQRAGRAGRTKEGLYVLAQLESMPCSALEVRPPYGVPEIMRKHIDRLVLRLAAIGLDIESLDFYHAPSKKTIKLAKQTLKSLGALSSMGGVTPIGRKMERFPVESGYARMLVESEAYSAGLQAALAAIIAVQEVGGIVRSGVRFTGWRRFTRQTRSDLLAQYDVYLALPTISPDDFEELGIIPKNVTKALEVNERLNRDLGLGDMVPVTLTEAEIDQLLLCIVAGQLHQLWTIEPQGEVTHIFSGKRRRLSNGTVVKHAALVAGTPFDLQVPNVQGIETLHLVTDVTVVKPEWLAALAPDVFSVKSGSVYFDSRFGALVSRTLLQVNRRTFTIPGTPVMEYSPKNQALFVKHYSAWLHERVETERQALQAANSRRIPKIPLEEVAVRVRNIVNGAVSLHELHKQQRTELGELVHVRSYLDRRFMSTLRSPEDSRRHGHDQDRHGRRFVPRHKRSHKHHYSRRQK